jgi:aspartate aminotransferase-like enzyme
MTELDPGWFLPGPSQVHPEVIAAMGGPPMAAASRDRIRSLLKDLFRTAREVMVLASSPTGMMEAAVRSGVEERVLVVIGGSSGERFAQVAEACGKEVVRAMVPAGRTLESEHLVQFLDGPEVDAVALVHAESSTGSLAPLEALSRVVRSRKQVSLLVDAASSLGGCPVETDAWQLDFVFSGSQEALALPPGLALGVVSERLLARASKLSGRGTHLDLVQLANAQHPADGHDLPQVGALAVQLERIAATGGMEARWKRHHEMLNLVEEWVLLHPEFALLPPEGRRSWTVSCLRLPGNTTSDRVVRMMGERGWRIGQGWGELRDTTIRIGHMGEAHPADLSELLRDLDEVVNAISSSSV